jgi:hypothetical protein
MVFALQTPNDCFCELQYLPHTAMCSKKQAFTTESRIGQTGKLTKALSSENNGMVLCSFYMPSDLAGGIHGG